MRCRSGSERSDAGEIIVLEVTGIGQVEFGCGSIFFSCWLSENPSPARWKCGNPAAFCRISKPGGKSGKLAWVFEFSTLSTGRHFHGAFPLVVLGAQRRGLRFFSAALFAHRFPPHLEAVG